MLRLPGHGWRLFVAERIAGWSVADGSVVERGVAISALGRVTVGTQTNINRDVLVDGRGTVVIGDRVNISPEAQSSRRARDLGRSLPYARDADHPDRSPLGGPERRDGGRHARAC